MKWKVLIWVNMLLVAFTAAYVIGDGSRSVHVTKYAEFATDIAFDTASVTTIEPLYAVMGYAYADTFSYGVDTADYKTVTWTSPMQSIILTIGPITATPLVIDTTILLTVGCTAVFAGADELGIEYDTETGADDSLHTAIDSLVDIWNKRTNLKDSIVAQDSGTYIKLVSLIGEGTQKGPWTMQLSADSMDTAGTPDSVTIEMVCDSMPATINAEDSISLYAIAANSGDTAYTITALDAGFQLFDSTLNPADTHGTVTRTQANVAGRSIRRDTLNYNINIANQYFRGSGVYGDITLEFTTDTGYGIGGSDSGYLYLYSVGIRNDTLIYKLLKSDSANDIPFVMHVAIPHAAANDTIFQEMLMVAWMISDTSTITNAQAQYPIKIDLLITDGF